VLHRELARARSRKWYAAHKDVAAARIKAWHVANPERTKIIQRRAEAKRDRKAERRAIRAEVIAHYGNKCACPGCPETNHKFLTFDHINSDGAARRRKHQEQAAMIRKEGYPDDIRLLCWNCNSGRHYNGGTCPHME
jgi:hypothetical protein